MIIGRDRWQGRSGPPRRREARLRAAARDRGRLAQMSDVLRGHMDISPFSLAPASEGARRARRRSVIDCLEAIMRERNLNSRTTPQGVFRRPSNSGLLGRRRGRCAIGRRWTPVSRRATGASLTSNSPRAPLRQANNDPIRTRPLVKRRGLSRRKWGLSKVSP